jgi:hypothetical protein
MLAKARGHPIHPKDAKRRRNVRSTGNLQGLGNHRGESGIDPPGLKFLLFDLESGRLRYALAVSASGPSKLYSFLA